MSLGTWGELCQEDPEPPASPGAPVPALPRRPPACGAQGKAEPLRVALTSGSASRSEDGPSPCTFRLLVPELPSRAPLPPRDHRSAAPALCAFQTSSGSPRPCGTHWVMEPASEVLPRLAGASPLCPAGKTHLVSCGAGKPGVLADAFSPLPTSSFAPPTLGFTYCYQVRPTKI